MNSNGKVGVLYSWPVIILALCVFWPIGIFLLIKRVSKDKKTAMGAGKLISILGIVSYGIAILGAIVCISEGITGEDVGFILFFAAAGFALRKVAKGIVKNAENVKQYLSVIVNGNVRQLDTIASTTGKSYDAVYKDIKKMIEKGYLKNAYIDESMRELVLPENAPTTQNSINEANVNTNAAPARIVACPCCGANNTIYGSLGECEYCGSPLG